MARQLSCLVPPKRHGVTPLADRSATIGAGLAWPRFRIDLAYDTSDSYKVGSVSMVTRF